MVDHVLLPDTVVRRRRATPRAQVRVILALVPVKGARHPRAHTLARDAVLRPSNRPPAASKQFALLDSRSDTSTTVTYLSTLSGLLFSRIMLTVSRYLLLQSLVLLRDRALPCTISFPLRLGTPPFMTSVTIVLRRFPFPNILPVDHLANHVARDHCNYKQMLLMHITLSLP